MTAAPSQRCCNTVSSGNCPGPAVLIHYAKKLGAGRDSGVDRHGDKNSVEEKSDHAVPKHRAAHHRAFHHHVRNLTSHAYDEREIEKIPGAGFILARESQIAFIVFWSGWIVKIMQIGIVERHRRVQNEPGPR